MFHTILEIIMLNIVSSVLAAPPLLIYFLKALNNVLTFLFFAVLLCSTVLNVILVVCLDIAIGWKIFFIAIFVIALISPKSELFLMFSGSYIINCMFPEAITNALNEHILPTAWVANKVYMWSEITRPDIDNKIVLFVFCIITLIMLIVEGMRGSVFDDYHSDYSNS